MRKTIAIILAVLMFLFIAGCSISSECTIPAHTEDSDPVQTTEYITENTETNGLSVSLSFGNQLSIEAFLSLKDFIENRISLWCSDSIELVLSDTGEIDGANASGNYDIHGESRITYMSDDIVSIVTELLVNQKDAAHPCHLLMAYNYDPGALEVVTFADMYRIDDELYSFFSSEAEKKIMFLCGGKWPDHWRSFGEEFCSQDEFLTGMNTGDEYTYYLTEGGIVISIPVPHALGDHLEVELPEDLIKEFQS